MTDVWRVSIRTLADRGVGKKTIARGFQPKLVVDFAGGTLTTDAGLVLLREFDEQLGLSADVIGRIPDTRDARYVTHPLGALVRQRLYQIAAGYEDVNDADRLRRQRRVRRCRHVRGADREVVRRA